MAWYIEEQERIYMDYNATTPIDRNVECAMIEAFKIWGNPSSNHSLGKKARKVIGEARNEIAKLLDISSNEVYFTSGGTETNHWVIHSCIEHRKAVQGRDYKPHIITSAIEHVSILAPLRDLKKKNEIDLTEVGIEPLTGCIKLDELQNSFCDRTCLVTVMTANNETGVIQPIAAVADIAKKAGDKFEMRVFIHSDASQAIGKIDMTLNTLKADFITIAGHKFYGPRIGALVIRTEREIPLTAMFLGGDQERGKRSGTENTPMIVGLGKAAQLVATNLSEYIQHMERVRSYFERRLKETFDDGIVVNFKDSNRLPNTSSIAFVKYPGCASELLEKCKTFIASTGAACHAATLHRSAVLSACGVRDELAMKTARFSFGRESTCDEVDRVIAELKAIMFMGKHGSSLLSAINKGPVAGF